jgi:HEAT repeat protein
MDELNLAEAVGRALDTADPRLRADVQESVAALKRAGVQTAQAALTVLGERTADERLRLHACSVLGQIRYAPCEPVLLALLGNESDEAVVWEAAKATLQFASRSSVDALIAYIDRGPDLAAAAAAWCVGQRRETQAVAALVSVVVDRRRPAIVRDHAAEALGALRTKDAVDSLIGALSDESPDVRYSAAYALGEIGDRKALEPLKGVRRDAGMARAGAVSEAVEEAIVALEGTS